MYISCLLILLYFDSVRKAAADHTSLRQLWGDSDSQRNRYREREPSDDSGDESGDNSSDDDGKKVCLEYGFLDKVVLPPGPIAAADETCDPTNAAAYDPQQCPVYIEPFFLEDSSSSSAQYEQVDGKDAICIVDPLSSTAIDKFFMTYFGRLTSDPADFCKSVLCRNNINIVFSLFSIPPLTYLFYSNPSLRYSWPSLS